MRRLTAPLLAILAFFAVSLSAPASALVRAPGVMPAVESGEIIDVWHRGYAHKSRAHSHRHRHCRIVGWRYKYGKKRPIYRCYWHRHRHWHGHH